jgi:hypothetical protein
MPQEKPPRPELALVSSLSMRKGRIELEEESYLL